MRTTPFYQYSIDIGLRTTPFDQYFLGVEFLKNVPIRVALDQDLRTTPFGQYFLGINHFLMGPFQISLAYHWIGWILFHALFMEALGAFFYQLELAASIAVVLLLVAVGYLDLCSTNLKLLISFIFSRTIRAPFLRLIN